MLQPQIAHHIQGSRQLPFAAVDDNEVWQSTPAQQAIVFIVVLVIVAVRGLEDLSHVVALDRAELDRITGARQGYKPNPLALRERVGGGPTGERVNSPVIR